MPLRDKAKKIEEYLEDGIITEHDLIVIAININAVNGLWAYMDKIMMRTLYGVGDIILCYDRKRPGSKKIHHTIIEKVSKTSGAPVEIQPFVNESMKRISSVWAFEGNAIDRPQGLGGDCIQYPNLSSENCWLQSAVSLGEEWCFEESDEEWKGRKVIH